MRWEDYQIRHEIPGLEDSFGWGESRRGLGFGGAIRPCIGGGVVEACFAVVVDGLSSPHIHGEISADFELVAHAGELLANIGRHSVFDENFAAQVKIAANCEAGGLHGGLQIHAVVDDVRDELGVG